ncbi:response regulator transcription factor [Cohnella lupini]|uniref:Two-component system response regulator YesN n=1 Tax=Cohnella lupini TaxID=1294267 RepID=A0A3D9HT33_9BACL|nr:response regulator [Cohnella lupini]RED52609.1 two-component system response regulator YesN [Cohnella lupini]
MYRILIVDDEPVIVEGLLELFLQMKQWDLEVYKAYDGEDALAIAEKTRMDIVMTDIQMPVINGIELQRELRKRWPRCRVIFLTGYDDFSYIQSSIRGGVVDYVLKAEGDEPVIAAIEKAIGQISEELELEQLISSARTQWQQTLPMLRKEYLLELLQGEPAAFGAREERFSELDIPLCPDRPVGIVAGRVDQWREEMGPKDKALFMFAIQNVAEQLFEPDVKGLFLTTAPDRFVWLFQPKSRDDDSLETEVVLGRLESVQAACKQYLKLICSFITGSETCAWEVLSGKYERLTGMFYRGLGIGNEILLSDRRQPAPAEYRDAADLKKVHLLGQYLERKERDSFDRLLEELTISVKERTRGQEGYSLELYAHLSAVFLTYLNRRELLAPFSELLNLNPLYPMSGHKSWDEASDFFRRLAEMSFDRTSDESEKETNEVVRRIHDHVERRLEGDLSLTALSEIVHLTPFYLSRLYKVKTGANLIDYIIAARIDKAKELLIGSSLKIGEIAVRVGYESASYFGRFFKNATGLTPQQYRDSIK